MSKITCIKIAWWVEMILPIVLAIPFLFRFVIIDEENPEASSCLGVTIITAAYWIFEPIPIVITAFFPIFLLPFYTVSTSSKISSAMFTDTSLIFIGGFIFSIAMVKWNLHSRISLKTVLVFGLRPRVLLLGVTIVTSLLSFWISNTACALTMVPNSLAIISKMEEITGDAKAVEPFGKALLLMVAMASSTAGMVTLIGTPPNLVLSQTISTMFPQSEGVGFAQFMFVSLPISLVMLAVLYLYFSFVYMRKLKIPENIDETEFQNNYDRLGPMSIPEKIIIYMFLALALLWFFRSDINFGGFTLPGWSSLLYGSKGSNYIRDGVIAIFFAMMLFIIRVPPGSTKEEEKREKAEIDLELRVHTKYKKFRSPLEISSEETDDGLEEEDNNQEDLEAAEEEKSKEWIPVLEWEYVQQKMPWTILFLFAGGFALNQGFTDSHLDLWIGSKLIGLTNLDMYPLVLIITAVTMIMTNLIASNTAVANIFLPIVASVARSSGRIHPYLLIFPTAFACSFSYIIPVSTPPNLIAYSTGRLETKDFIITGLFLSVVAVIVTPPLCIWLIPPVFDAYVFPSWANASLVTV